MDAHSTITHCNNQNRRVLVLGDNPAEELLTVALLKKLGFTPSIVRDEDSALSALRESVFDLVVLDSHMPEINCIETTKIIRKSSSGVKNPNIPIVVLTNIFENLDCEQGRQVGINDFLSKPVSRDALEKHILPLMKNGEPIEQSLPILDYPELMTRISNDISLAKTLMEIFFNTFPDILSKLQLDIKSQDAVGARKQVHNIAGSASNIGARKLSRLAREIESIAKAGKVPEERMVNELALELEKLREVAKKEGLLN